MYLGNNESAGKRRNSRTRKGNSILPGTLTQTGQAAGRSKNTYLGATFATMTRLKVAELFDGIGGATGGFLDSGGYNSVFLHDCDPDARDTFILNFPELTNRYHLGNIEELMGPKLLEFAGGDIDGLPPLDPNGGPWLPAIQPVSDADHQPQSRALLAIDLNTGKRGDADQVASGGHEMAPGDRDRLHRLVDRAGADGVDLRGRSVLTESPCKRPGDLPRIRLSRNFEGHCGPPLLQRAIARTTKMTGTTGR